MEILRCEHLCKQYGTGNACVKALDDVSFSVEKGEFVSIIGPSGSGKSTLLHILGGVDRPTSGKVFVNGTELHSLKEDQLAIFRRRQIGLVYQFYNLLPVLTVDENIMLPHLLDGHPKDPGAAGSGGGGDGAGGPEKQPSEPALRRTAAASLHWPGYFQPSLALFWRMSPTGKS